MNVEDETIDLGVYRIRVGAAAALPGAHLRLEKMQKHDEQD